MDTAVRDELEAELDDGDGNVDLTFLRAVLIISNRSHC